MEHPTQIPIVFVSSTSEDLIPYREAVRDAALSAQFHPDMMEYFLPSGEHAPLKACLTRVAGADVLVVIVAHRYGWVPNPAEPKSITWWECLEAQRLGKEVLAFLVDGEWPVELKESYRVAEALETNTFTAELPTEVKRNIAMLAEFKQWLNGLGLRTTFANPDDLGRKVEGALRGWRDRRRDAVPAPMPKGREDPSAYLEYLRKQTASIDLLLQVGERKAFGFPIEDLYIPLTTPGKALEGDKVAAPKLVPLEDALTYQRLVIVGDPGAGKTTFLRHVAYLRTRALLDAKANGLLFPIFIGISELVEHILHSRKMSRGPAGQDNPAWLIDFLNTRNDDLNWALHPNFFREKLLGGNSILLLDGLDEAPGQDERDSIARLFKNATGAYPACRFVVTTRQLAFTGLAGFETAQIAPLEQPAIETFLEHWCRSVVPASAGSADLRLGNLREALSTRVEIRRMARNPMMLAALAAVPWNEGRLPEQRADLYESILMWLASAGEKRPRRQSAESCLTLLQQLALAMQNLQKGRQAQVEKGWAADVLTPYLSGRATALAFVEQQEVDSGILVSQGREVRFWHLTFQEYLAARAIAGLADTAQHKLLLDQDKIYKPEWREVALLLAGVLIRQGLGKVDGLFKAAVDGLGRKPTFVQQARCAGLLGAMLSDLDPLNYKTRNSGYGAALKAALGVFDAKKAAKIDFTVRLDAAEALGQADTRLTEYNWVTMKAGEFWLGAQMVDSSKPNYDLDAKKDEGPVRLVQLGAYQIGRYPVTVSEYRRFMDKDGYAEDQWWSAGGFGGSKEPKGWEEQVLHPNRPVVAVSWYEAKAYCAWAGARLPAEAEWERAARGEKSRKYPWGSESPDAARANFGNRIGRPTPVGLYPAGATPEGIQDLAGNMREWMEDRYEGGESRVTRGGSYDSEAKWLRASCRDKLLPGNRYDLVGFRCVLGLVP